MENHEKFEKLVATIYSAQGDTYTGVLFSYIDEKTSKHEPGLHTPTDGKMLFVWRNVVTIVFDRVSISTFIHKTSDLTPDDVTTIYKTKTAALDCVESWYRGIQDSIPIGPKPDGPTNRELIFAMSKKIDLILEKMDYGR